MRARGSILTPGCLVLTLVYTALLPGCLPELGSCDEEGDQGRQLVYVNGGVDDGLPYYAGQAYMRSSCAGDGAFCHARNATSPFGAPRGLNYDLTLACRDDVFNAQDCLQHYPEEHSTLINARKDVSNWRRYIYREVQRGHMPPGRAGRSVVNASSSYRLSPEPEDPILLPKLGSSEGREILREWLACGNPIVWRAEEPDQGQVPGDLCNEVSGVDANGDELVEEGIGDCVVRQQLVIDPSWTSIYALVIEPECTACHDQDPENPLRSQFLASGGLNLNGQEDAYQALVVESIRASSTCIGEATNYVAPGDPDGSYLMDKIGPSGPMLCGGVRMPIGGGLAAIALEAIQEWIANGAQND
ncbi:MAG: hypothetical protein AAF355_13945 [Myxococcota bacterium]